VAGSGEAVCPGQSAGSLMGVRCLATFVGGRKKKMHILDTFKS
jgi:hypothetical protein